MYSTLKIGGDLKFFLNDLSVESTSLLNSIRREKCDNLTSEVMWYKI